MLKSFNFSVLYRRYSPAIHSHWSDVFSVAMTRKVCVCEWARRFCSAGKSQQFCRRWRWCKLVSLNFDLTLANHFSKFTWLLLHQSLTTVAVDVGSIFNLHKSLCWLFCSCLCVIYGLTGRHLTPLPKTMAADEEKTTRAAGEIRKRRREQKMTITSWSNFDWLWLNVEWW